MVDVRMHSTIADQSHDVQLMGAAALHGFQEQRLAEKLAGGDFCVEARDVHLHDAASSDVEMAYFAVAHLLVGKTDKRPGSVNQHVGEFLDQRIVDWLAREGDSISIGGGRVAPAVEDGEHDWFRALCHSISLN